VSQFTKCTFLLFLLVWQQTLAQVNLKDTLLLKNHIGFLCHDSLAGRKAGSEGEMIAVQYVEDAFAEQKLSFFFNNGFAESFIFIDDNGEMQMSRNVSAFINNKADSTIIIMAHVDHLGLGGVKSKSYTNSKIHYGADDNASGIAALILIAKYLKQPEFQRFNYLLIATGAHEPGYFGANSFVRKYGNKLANVKLIVNLDMIGRVNTQTQTMYALTNESSFALFQNIELHLPLMTFKVNIDEMNEGDHTPFHKAGFAVMHITSGMHDDYHKTSDTPDKINYQGIVSIMNFLLEMIKVM
jgi:Zn-dependent M28 family amino/carboxypeptidase